MFCITHYGGLEVWNKVEATLILYFYFCPGLLYFLIECYQRVVGRLAIEEKSQSKDDYNGDGDVLFHKFLYFLGFREGRSDKFI